MTIVQIHNHPATGNTGIMPTTKETVATKKAMQEQIKALRAQGFRKESARAHGSCCLAAMTRTDRGGWVIERVRWVEMP